MANVCLSCAVSDPFDGSICPECGTETPYPGDGRITSPPPPHHSEELLRRLRSVTSGEFELLREIGHGGMARVFLAYEIALERQVAIKVLSPLFSEYPEIVRRFQHEARTAGQLSHPNIVSVYAVYQGDGLSFFTMPFIRGASLRQVLKQQGTVEPDRALDFVRQAAAGLAYAHEHGVIHRDVKPENMILEASTGRLALTDFGLAKAIGSESLTLPGDMIGTPHYMAPEQCEAQDRVDGRTDQYSLALVVYEMLAGEHPFASDGLRELLIKQLTETPAPLRERVPGIPRKVSDAIQIALSKDPENRFPGVDAFARALTGDAEPRLISVRHASPQPAAAGNTQTVWMRDSLMKLHRRRRIRVWLGRASLTTAAALVGYLAVVAVGGSPGIVADPEAIGDAGTRPGFVEVPPSRTEPGAELAGPPAPARRAGGADRARTAAAVSDPPAAPSRPAARRGSAESSTRPARSSNGDPTSVIESYRRAIQGEDLEALSKTVYAGAVPEDDLEILRLIFDRADDLQVDMKVGDVESDGDLTTADVDFPMRYVLAKTQRPQNYTLKLRLTLEESSTGWRVATARPR